jgi:hypothetical protein
MRTRRFPAVWLTAVLTAATPVVHAEASRPHAVGYVNVRLHAGHNVVGAQLFDSPDGVPVRALFQSGGGFFPAGSQMIRGHGAAATTNTFDGSDWERPDELVPPGEGLVVVSPEPALVTHAGRVLQGGLPVFVPAGRSWRAASVPQAGRLGRELALPLVEGLQCFGLATNGVEFLRATVVGGRWEPTEPTVKVGEGFGLGAPQSLLWRREFFVTDGSDPAEMPRFTEHPADVTLAPGAPLRLAAATDRPAAHALQWFRDGAPVPGATGPELLVPAATTADAGLYWARALTTNGLVNVSLPARVNVAAAGPVLVLIPEGGRLALSAEQVPDGAWVVQRSPDFQTRTDWQTSAPPATIHFFVPDGAARFFRLVQRP